MMGDTKRRKIKHVLPETYINAAVSYYNIMFNMNIQTVDQIPHKVLQNIMLYDETELWRPHMAALARRGKSYRHIADICGVPVGIARSIWNTYKSKS